MSDEKDLVERIVFCQKWLESERSWGARPDGFSLHKSLFDRNEFVEKYWNDMPKGVPDIYSMSLGSPYQVKVEENELYQGILDSNYGIRIFSDEGWREI